jgi:hypothetical protein
MISPEDLLRIGSKEGARALGLEDWPGIEVDIGHASLAGVARDELEPALLFGCSGEVFSL